MTAAPEGGSSARSDVRVRLVSAVVMLAVAVVGVGTGGPVFAAMVAIAVALVMLEWTALCGPLASRALAWGPAVLVAVSSFSARWEPLAAITLIGVVAATITLFSVVEPRARWIAAGLLYAGLPGVAAVVLRGTAPPFELSYGLAAVVFVVIVVVTTDTAAYFAGRAIGGPKLWPQVSPKKTWSGAIGGLLAAVLLGTLFDVLVTGSPVLPVVLVAAVLSAVSQAGDLAESAMKRHFGVKDSGRIIPGHGGIMDRFDGLIVALLVAAVIGVLRGGPDAVAEGVVAW